VIGLHAKGANRIGWALLALAYLFFVIYGSLVPLDYQPLPFDEALRRFGRIRYLDLGIGSRADWVANILLFIPLCFLWTGLFWPNRPGTMRLLVSILVFVSASLLSFGIEFTQLFFPPRTVSQNDIFAETIGAAAGIALWWWRGPRIRDWLADALAARGPTQLAEKLLWVYLAGLFLYSLLPLDLTISPVEIYHKWRSGKVNLIPFGFYISDPAQRIYDLVTDALIWVPVSLLWMLSGRKNARQAWAWTVLAATLLECLQFFIYSRVSDVTDVLTAMIGAGLGIWATRFIPHTEYRTGESLSSDSRNLALTLVACLVWILILMVVFWYPFDFRFDWSFLRERARLLLQVPFRAYYYGTEFRAVTELLHKILFFAPLGAILVFGRPREAHPLWQTLYGVAAIGLLLAVPVGIELGQVALPNKNPDGTDLVLEFLGGCAGYFGLRSIRRRFRPAVNRDRNNRKPPLQQENSENQT
jgi:glycopeptide antibiotics resistance protein